MIFQHTWEKVLSGEKSQTRRLVKRCPEGMRIGGDYVFEAVAADDVVHFPEGSEIQRVSTVYYRHGGWLTGDLCVEPDERLFRKYQIGHTYAVQPGRGQKAIARIEITRIRCEDVRTISWEDLKAEGFGFHGNAKEKFLWVWCGMHDKTVREKFRRSFDDILTMPYDLLAERPAAFYDAWVLDFKVVQS